MFTTLAAAATLAVSAATGTPAYTPAQPMHSALYGQLATAAGPTVLPNGVVTWATGTTVYPGGTVQWANGTVVVPGGTTVWPNGTVTVAQAGQQ